MVFIALNMNEVFAYSIELIILIFKMSFENKLALL